ncbi:M14 family zinc carboxypeptidase [Cyclobacterium amurskyense]|uniref:Peptidase M14 carboxypeptidase A n=1 Tax=Cyclobacterium amurskyense TaxID=320787 RepID=A0A0H4PG16_9BACT|nr:M14 family zinc carboxypeptidase [Cyclobacterium amurskyense]AKP53169.1 Peptidase M14 carboxypeptidase A [Cyclobacterium amurskyense]
MLLNKLIPFIFFATVLFIPHILLGQDELKNPLRVGSPNKLNFANRTAETPIIESDFPGGNVVIDKVFGDTIFFKPDLRDTPREWFYWCFTVKSTSNKKWFFKATKPNVLTNLGAAFSTDGGYEWNWIDQENHLGPDLFSFKFSGDGKPVMLSMGMAYTQKNFDKYMLKHKNSKYLRKSVLSTTRAGRKVEQLLVSNFDSEPKFRVLFTARAHAGEMMSNYIIEGMLDALTSNNTRMDQFLDKVEIMIIPFLDKDGVEQGDQGKYRSPRDHNRDYSGESIYTSTKAIREDIPKWIDGLPWVGIDLHNPWIKGENNEWVYFVGNEDERISAAQENFVNTLIRTQQGPLTINSKTGFLAYGTAWNKGSNYEQGYSFSKWASGFLGEGLIMPTTLEFPFGINNGQLVTQEKARLFGKDLIFALSEYIEGQ